MESSGWKLRAHKALESKRKKTLKKKSHQLATLCGVPVCLIYYGQDGNVATYPEDRKEVRDILMRYKGHADNAKIENLEEIEEKKKKKNKRSKEVEEGGGQGGETWDRRRVDYLPEESLAEILMSLDNKLKAVNDRIELEESKRKKERGGFHVLELDGQRIGQGLSVMELDLVGSFETSNSCTVTAMEEDMWISSTCTSNSRADSANHGVLGRQFGSSNLLALQLFS